MSHGNAHPARILVALGEGGHTKEMLVLVDRLGDDIQFGYLIVDDDEVTESKIALAGDVYHVQRPRDKDHHLAGDVLKTLRSAWHAFRSLRDFRPTAVLSSGPSIAVPVSILARLMGADVIFVETGSRVTVLSTTGKIMYHIAHMFFVQWPELRDRYPRAIYAGRLV